MLTPVAFAVAKTNSLPNRTRYISYFLPVLVYANRKGLSHKAFADECGVNYRSLYLWVERLNQGKDTRLQDRTYTLLHNYAVANGIEL